MFDNQEWMETVSKIDYSVLPEHLQGGFRRYIEKGIEMGSFGNAVLTNDLFLAFGNADDICQANMQSIVTFVYSQMPMICYGTPEKVQSFINNGPDGDEPMADKFFCSECGVDRDLGDAVTPINDGEGLCRFCNKQLEIESGKGCPESKVTYLNTPKVNDAIAESILAGQADMMGKILGDAFSRKLLEDD